MHIQTVFGIWLIVLLAVSAVCVVGVGTVRIALNYGVEEGAPVVISEISSYLGYYASITTAIAAIGSLALLIVNAVLIHMYVGETRRLADAAQYEYDPNIQILFKKEERTVNRVPTEGIFLRSDGICLVPILLKNLSKRPTKFIVKFHNHQTYISTMVQKVQLNASYTATSLSSRVNYLKPSADTRLHLPFDFGEDFACAGLDYSQAGILKSSTLYIGYSINYPEGRYHDDETWFLTIDGVTKISEGGWLLMGDWFLADCKRTGFF